MHISRFHAAEHAAEAAARAAAILGSDRSRDDFSDLRAIASEVRFFAAGMADNVENLKSGAVTPLQFAEIQAKLAQRLTTYLTPTE